MYKLFGLCVDADFDLHATVSDSAVADLTLRAGEALSDNAFCLNIPDIANFQVKDGLQIAYQPHGSVSMQDLRLFLMGSCMGALLQQRGLIVLHGNAITWNHKTCTIYVGEQGAGKSTTSAYAYQQGASLVADDICAIYLDENQKAYVYPGLPQLKLWQASCDLLNISTKNLARVREQFDKFIFPIPPHRFASAPCELEAIIEVNQALKAPEAVFGLQKLLKLQTHTYRYHFLARMGLEHAYLTELMQLANRVKFSSMPRIALDGERIASYEMFCPE